MLFVLGKEELKKGFCINTAKLNREEYLKSLDTIRKYTEPNKKLRVISLTSSSILKRFEDHVIPTIVKYNKDIDAIFEPAEIYNNCTWGLDEFRPSADFVIFNNGFGSTLNDNIAVAAYSATAPVFVFENQSGQVAIGVLTKPRLIEYGEYVFDKILSQMTGNVKLTIPLCTHYSYPEWGSIPEFISVLAEKFQQITELEFEEDTQTNENLFGYGEKYNNCVVIC